jgi:hypothetical protein
MFDQIITYHLALAAVACTAIMLFVGRIPVGRAAQLNETKLWARAGTLFVLALGVGVALIPGVAPDGAIGQKILWGCVVALCAAFSRSILKPFGLERLEAKIPERVAKAAAAEVTPSTAATVEEPPTDGAA